MFFKHKYYLLTTLLPIDHTIKVNKKARDRGFKKEREEWANEFTKRNCFVKENVID